MKNRQKTDSKDESNKLLLSSLFLDFPESDKHLPLKRKNIKNKTETIAFYFYE
jgi:hypothetical protein